MVVHSMWVPMYLVSHEKYHGLLGECGRSSSKNLLSILFCWLRSVKAPSCDQVKLSQLNRKQVQACHIIPGILPELGAASERIGIVKPCHWGMPWQWKQCHRAWRARCKYGLAWAPIVRKRSLDSMTRGASHSESNSIAPLLPLLIGAPSRLLSSSRSLIEWTVSRWCQGQRTQTTQRFKFAWNPGSTAATQTLNTGCHVKCLCMSWALIRWVHSVVHLSPMGVPRDSVPEACLTHRSRKLY